MSLSNRSGSNGENPLTGGEREEGDEQRQGPTGPQDTVTVTGDPKKDVSLGFPDYWTLSDYGYAKYVGAEGVYDPEMDLSKLEQPELKDDAKYAWTYDDARTYWGQYLNDPTAAAQFKALLHTHGYYSGAYTPNYQSPRITPEDIEALSGAMGDSNLSGWGKRDTPGFEIHGPQGFIALMGPKENPENDLDAVSVATRADSRMGLKKWLWDNGLALPQEQVQKLVTRITDSNDSDSEFTDITKNLTKQYLIPTYPAYKEALQRGETVADLSAPYKQRFAEMLETPADQVDLMDPLLQKAMQGDGEGDRTQSMAIWQFDDLVRNDKRWQYTDNAWDTVGDDMAGVMKMFGAM